MELVDGLMESLVRLKGLWREQQDKDFSLETTHLLAVADQVSAKALHLRNVVHLGLKFRKPSSKKKRARVEEEFLDEGTVKLKPQRKTAKARKVRIEEETLDEGREELPILEEETLAKGREKLPQIEEEILDEGKGHLPQIEEEILDEGGGDDDEITRAVALNVQKRPRVESSVTGGNADTATASGTGTANRTNSKGSERILEDESEEVLDEGHGDDVCEIRAGREKRLKRSDDGNGKIVAVKKRARARRIHKENDETMGGTYEMLQSGNARLPMKLRHKRRKGGTGSSGGSGGGSAGGVKEMDEMLIRGLAVSEEKRKKHELEKTKKPYAAALRVVGVKMVSKKYKKKVGSNSRRRKAFEDDLQAAMIENGRMHRQRKMNNKALDLHGLFREVLMRGGAECVFRDGKLLREVYLRSGNHAPKAEIGRLKAIYCNSLYFYECLFVHGVKISVDKEERLMKL